MHRSVARVLLSVLLAGFLAASPGVAQTADEADSPDLEAIAIKAVDVFPIRVGGAFRLIAGSLLLVPATLFSTLGLPLEWRPAVYRENFDYLVAEPFDYTFRRPLGTDLAGG